MAKKSVGMSEEDKKDLIRVGVWASIGIIIIVFVVLYFLGGGSVAGGASGAHVASPPGNAPGFVQNFLTCMHDGACSSGCVSPHGKIVPDADCGGGGGPGCTTNSDCDSQCSFPPGCNSCFNGNCQCGILC